MHYIVDFKNTASQDQVNQYLAVNGLTIVKEYDNFDKIYVVETTVEPPTTEITQHIVVDDEHAITLLNTTILSDQDYGKKKLDGEILTIENNDTNWWKSYTIQYADLDSPFYHIDRRGQNSVVYVLDSGIETTHNEFTNRKVNNLWSFNNDFTDKKGHGTAIAGVIVGNTVGISDATVKSVKIFDPNTPTKQSDILSALDVIFQDVIQNQIDFAIVNCSWTISKNLLIESKMTNMLENGILIIAAAGNSGHAIDDVTPASLQEALTIGAYNSNLQPCDFSNYTYSSMITFTSNVTNHGELDGWAPGQNIYTAGLQNSYGMVSGTSIAAAIQSAALAYNLSYCTPLYRRGRTYKDFYSEYSLNRKDLLNLYDSKYAKSKNRITTIYDQLKFPEGIRYNLTLRGNSDEYSYLNVFYPHITVKLEIFGILPPEYTITSSGKLIGKNPIITNNYSYNKIPVRITYTDNTVIDADLEIIVLGNDFDPSQSTGDPVMDYKLQNYVTSCYEGNYNCFHGGYEACWDACDTGTYCYIDSNAWNNKICDDVNSYACICIPF
jgi:subtilisin family serine protease